MTRVTMKKARDNLKALVDRAEAGEEIALLRRGKEVARIVPPAIKPKRIPSRAAFRASIEVAGEPTSETVIRARREERF